MFVQYWCVVFVAVSDSATVCCFYLYIRLYSICRILRLFETALFTCYFFSRHPNYSNAVYIPNSPESLPNATWQLSSQYLEIDRRPVRTVSIISIQLSPSRGSASGFRIRGTMRSRRPTTRTRSPSRSSSTP